MGFFGVEKLRKTTDLSFIAAFNLPVFEPCVT